MHVQSELFRIRRRDTGACLDHRFYFSPRGYHWRRDLAEKHLADIKAGDGPPHFTYGVVEQLELYPVSVCGVCGAWGVRATDSEGRIHRCWKHENKHACAIDGCSRSRKTDGVPLDDWWLCSEHWRAFCPPRSPMRRIYNRVWREGKKRGWPRSAHRRLQRVWHAIIRRARQAHSGQFEAFVDEAEINRMFGWE